MAGAAGLAATVRYTELSFFIGLSVHSLTFPAPQRLDHFRSPLPDRPAATVQPGHPVRRGRPSTDLRLAVLHVACQVRVALELKSAMFVILESL